MRNQDGFTLVELIAVVIILGVIVSTVAWKFGMFEGAATQSVITSAIKELNTREKLTWSNVKLSDDRSKPIDELVRDLIDWDIGNGTHVDESRITVRGHSAAVVRTPATSSTPAIWSRQ